MHSQRLKVYGNVHRLRLLNARIPELIHIDYARWVTKQRTSRPPPSPCTIRKRFDRTLVVRTSGKPRKRPYEPPVGKRPRARMRTSPKGRDELVYRLLGQCEHSVSEICGFNGSTRFEQDLIMIFPSCSRWVGIDIRIRMTSSRQVERRNNNLKRSRSSRAKSRECSKDTGISRARIGADGLPRGMLRFHQVGRCDV